MLKKIENIIILLLVFVIELISIFCIRPIFIKKIDSIQSLVIINIAFFIVLFLVLKAIFHIGKKIRKNDKFYITFLKITLIYFLIMILFLFIIYPGYLLYDEFWVFSYSEKYMLDGWQSYISIVLYTMSLYIIPHPIGIEIFQLIIISMIMGYVQTRIKYIFNSKIASIIMFLIYITPVFLINNTYLLRGILYGYVVLLFYCIIFCDYIEKSKMTKAKFILFIILTFLMINWRSEGIVFLFCNIFCIIFTYKEIRKKTKILLLITLVLVPMFMYSRICPNKMYTAVTTVMPLSIMLNHNLKGENIQEDINTINKVFYVKNLKKYPNYHFIKAYWDGHIIQYNAYKNINKDFYMAFLDIIINNFLDFLNVRIKVLKYTFSTIEYPANLYETFINGSSMQPLPESVIKNVVFHYNLYPINYDVKHKVQSFLVENRIIKNIFWTGLSIIIFILLLLIMIVNLIKKEWLMFILSITLFIKMFITFMTSTASYFMYYFTEYVVGILVIFMFFMIKFNKQVVRR